MRRAFTLAEVLITLGIIGVVAALTIPTLIANYNAKAWNTAAEVFDKKLEDTLKVMNSQSTLAGYTTTEEFVAELSKHFKTNKICEGTKLLDCFTDVVYWGGGEATPEEVDMTKVKAARHFGQKTWNTNLVGVQFANGVNALIAYNPTEECVQDPHSNQISGQKCLAILYDTSGSKNPNTSGKDLRSINVSHLGSTCTFEIGDTCFTSFAFKPEPMTYADCAGENAGTAGTATEAGAEAKKLGIQMCKYANDYWAGAVRQCGGIDKMPTLQQATDLAAYLYGFNNASPTDTVYCPTDSNGDYTYCRNTELTKSLGFDLSAGDTKTVHIWTNQEGTKNSPGGDAYYKNVNARALQTYFNNTRNQAVIYAFCIGK